MDQPAQIITEPTPQPVSVNIQPSSSANKSNKGPLIVFLVTLGLIFTGGLAYAGMQIGKKQSQIPTLPTPVPTEVLIPTLASIPTEVTTPTTILSTPTPDPTAGWKTYTDTESKIEFKYPNEWEARALPGWTLNVFLENHPFEIPQATEFMTSIQINFNEVMNTITNEKYFSEKILDEGVKRIESLYDQKTMTRSDMMVGGKKAVQISGLWGPGMLEGHYFKETLIQMDSKLLVVSLTNKEFEDIYNQILSTFKFLPSRVTLTPNPTAGWKTYINDFAKFSLEYPDTLTFTEKSFSDKEKQVIFKGSEGSLTINMATSDYSPGWGGGCDPKDKKKITFLGNQVEVCLNDTGMHELYPNHPSGKWNLNISATFLGSPIKAQGFFDQILATFEFLP